MQKGDSIMQNGIDVSSWQKEIDWQEVKNSGVEFAILRCGFGKNIEAQDDNTFIRNADECKRLNMPFGVYLYSYATDVSSAESEAQHVLRLIKNYTLTYPVYYDMEDEKTLGSCSNVLLADIAEKFCETIENAGYYVGIYSSLSWFNNRLTDKRFEQWDKWIAQYNRVLQFKGPHTMWQYTSSGTIPGIAGNVDKNKCYVDYPAIISNVHEGKKSNQEIAREVIQGKWGNGNDRKERLTIAGYNYEDVQSIVNQIYQSAGSEKTYVVKKGDTLSGIAEMYGTTYQLLAKYNKISDPNKIYVGQNIRIPV